MWVLCSFYLNVWMTKPVAIQRQELLLIENCGYIFEKRNEPRIHGSEFAIYQSVLCHNHLYDLPVGFIMLWVLSTYAAACLRLWRSKWDPLCLLMCESLKNPLGEQACGLMTTFIYRVIGQNSNQSTHLSIKTTSRMTLSICPSSTAYYSQKPTATRRNCIFLQAT